MAEQQVMVANVFCLLLGFFVLLSSVAGFPELDAFANNYIPIGLNTDKICHPFSRNVKDVTELRESKDSAIIIKPYHVFDSGQLKYNKQCKFKIKGPKKDNLFAVVQRMSLRRNGTECLDYVMFEPEESNHKPIKYCGKVITNSNGIKTYISGLS